MAATFTHRAAAFAVRCQNLFALPPDATTFRTIPDAF
jgi:hypothetical protein